MTHAMPETTCINIHIHSKQHFNMKAHIHTPRIYTMDGRMHAIRLGGFLIAKAPRVGAACVGGTEPFNVCLTIRYTYQREVAQTSTFHRKKKRRKPLPSSDDSATLLPRRPCYSEERDRASRCFWPAPARPAHAETCGGHAFSRLDLAKQRS